MPPITRIARPIEGAFALALGMILAAPPVQARQGAEPRSVSEFVAPLSAIDVLKLPSFDRNALLLEDEENARTKPGPQRFAQSIEVFATPQNSGTWETLADGSRLWRLRIEAPGATDLNLGFTRYELPAGATLHFLSEIQDHFEGPYTFEDNEEHGQLWLPVVPGDLARIELYVPAAVKFEPALELTHVGYGYRDFFHLERHLDGRQGFCNNDVICPEGDPWRDEIAAAAVYSLNGSFTCSGTLLNNVAGDFKPYFLSAYHCVLNSSTAPTMVVYWNYESPVCGNLCCGSLAQNQTGAIFRAGREDVDFALVELDEDPDPDFGVFFGGWENAGTAPLGSVGIHHPGTDEKAISFNDDLLTTQNSCIGPGTNTHWRVDNWEDGTTEPGSSGSSLWNPATHRIVGFLSGGLASCTNINYDCYGKFSVAWDGTSSATRLRDWLDPAGTGATFVEGSFASGAGSLKYVSHAADPDTCFHDPAQTNDIWEPGENITVPVTIRASGGSHTSITGTLTCSTPGVTILDGTATWPNLVSGASSASDAPHFRIELDESIACLSTIEFQLSISSAEGGPYAEGFSEPVGQAVLPSDLPLSIPDNVPAGVISSVNVATAVTLTDVNCRVRIDHTWVGDLIVRLRSPLGTTITLLDRPGVPASGNGCNNDNMDVTFDSSSLFNLENHCPGTNPWYTGVAAPAVSLNAFNGQNSSGTWQLLVSDHAGQDVGQILEWELLTTPPLEGLCEACTGDAVGIAGLTGGIDRLMLLQNQPNPFTGATTIGFALPREELVSLDVFDVGGRLVRRLLDGPKPAGAHQVRWDGLDAAGRAAGTGIYFYRLQAGGESEIKRLNLVR